MQKRRGKRLQLNGLLAVKRTTLQPVQPIKNTHYKTKPGVQYVLPYGVGP